MMLHAGARTKYYKTADGFKSFESLLGGRPETLFRVVGEPLAIQQKTFVVALQRFANGDPALEVTFQVLRQGQGRPGCGGVSELGVEGVDRLGAALPALYDAVDVLRQFDRSAFP
ncbi:hypothetical protein PYR67_09210 [Rhizobium sp. BC49]|uniref:hypothetical protein n=2 Tax=Rhizobium TaxID=379 RepID=UPI001C932C52|nr:MULTISPECIES: hypothetical protein [Rhizobium]MDF0659519.1 hypothetical protein [Rhizobium sp. BC49]ULJ79394.1 hypothetical protein MF410_04830 [Rhizobium sp. C104]